MTTADRSTTPVTPIELVLPVEGMTCASCVNRIERPGTYRIVCSVPGHEDAGMTGTLAVQP